MYRIDWNWNTPSANSKLLCLQFGNLGTTKCWIMDDFEIIVIKYSVNQWSIQLSTAKNKSPTWQSKQILQLFSTYVNRFRFNLFDAISIKISEMSLNLFLFHVCFILMYLNNTWTNKSLRLLTPYLKLCRIREWVTDLGLFSASSWWCVCERAPATRK